MRDLLVNSSSWTKMAWANAQAILYRYWQKNDFCQSHEQQNCDYMIVYKLITSIHQNAKNISNWFGYTHGFSSIPHDSIAEHI